MRNFFPFIVLLSLFTSTLNAQCTEQSEPKVLLVGDSWAFFMSVDQTINTVFRQWGHSDVTFYSNIDLAINGAETGDFLEQSKLDEIADRLNEYPSIEFIHLSIGGNDALGDWNVNFSPEQTDSLVDTISNRLAYLVDLIKAIKPDIKILWSGYVYPNFGEVIESVDPFQATHPFYGTWEGMGFPTFDQINGILNTFSQRAELYVDTVVNLDFVSCPGLMQYTFGQEEPLGVPPGVSYPAYTLPLPFGNPNYPSPKESMRDYGLTKDCFHLSPQGYRNFISFHTQKYYHKALMHDFYALPDTAFSGSVSQLALLPDTFWVGNTGNSEYKTILSFNLNAMADTGITKASLFLRRESIVGNNPINTGITVKLAAPYFGQSINIEYADLDENGLSEAIPCQFGANDANGNWIRLDLPSSFYPYIQSGNSLQLMLQGATNGAVRFTNAQNPDFAPVLDITYGPKAVSLPELPKPRVSIYPNPTNGLVTISGKESYTFAGIYNLAGQLICTMPIVNQQFDVSALKSGLYLVTLCNNKGVSHVSLMKE